jgi:hypothetical protein
MNVNLEKYKMAFEQKDNTGAIFVNEHKTEETHADRTGSALIGGREFWINGWLKKTKDGKPYLSLSFKLKEERASKNRRDNPDDDIF